MFINQMLQKIIVQLKQDSESNSKYNLENYNLHYKGRMVLAKNSVWIPKLMSEFHAIPLGGHSRMYKTYSRNNFADEESDGHNPKIQEKSSFIVHP